MAMAMAMQAGNQKQGVALITHLRVPIAVVPHAQTSKSRQLQPMALRGGSTESPRVGALAITVTAFLLLLLLFLSCLPLSTNAADSPAPAPVPAPPARHRPPPLGPGNKKRPRGATPGVPPHTHQVPRRGRPLPAPARPSTWWHRLNFGERFGIALAGAAVLAQVALAAFLAVRARQLLRRATPGAGAGKAAEERLEAASPTPAA